MHASKRFTVRALTGLSLLGALLLSTCRAPGTGGPREERADLLTGKSEPKETKGAPYPPYDPLPRDPNEETPSEPVPTGSKRGDLQPASPPMTVTEITQRDEGGGGGGGGGGYAAAAPAIVFRDYAELVNSIGSSGGCCPEPSVAQNGDTIIVTGNSYMALSEDGGASFSNINPTTLFPQSDGGFCCDQVVQYVPEIDIFVWLLQYWAGSDGRNRLRMAAQTTALVRSSNGAAWTYWDFPRDQFNDSGILDYNDMSFGNSSLWCATQCGGRIVARIPLSQIQAKSTITYAYTPPTSNALWSQVSHDADRTVYWAGHLNNSQLRVYSMRDGDNFYSWRTVNVNSWPNAANASLAPDGTDWMAWESNKNYVYGNVVQGEYVWFGWQGSAGGGFPQSHIQLVRIDRSSFTLQEQVQVWNPDVAFQDPYLSANSRGEIGMAVAFGGGTFYPSHAVGVWGDFVVYYPRLSTRASTRWGDYTTCRRSGSDGSQWVAAGYTLERDDTGANINRPHYIRFSR